MSVDRKREGEAIAREVKAMLAADPAFKAELDAVTLESIERWAATVKPTYLMGCENLSDFRGSSHPHEKARGRTFKTGSPPPAGKPGWDAPSRRPGGGGRSWVKNW